MSEAEFWACTPRFLQARFQAWEKAQQREAERGRLIGYLAASPYFDGKRLAPSPQAFYRLPWEALPKPMFEQVDTEALKKAHEEAILIFKKMGLPVSDNGNNLGTEHTPGATH